MQLSRCALCGLLDPAARGPVPGLVALTSGLGYRGGGAPYNRGAETVEGCTGMCAGEKKFSPFRREGLGTEGPVISGTDPPYI